MKNSEIDVIIEGLMWSRENAPVPHATTPVEDIDIQMSMFRAFLRGYCNAQNNPKESDF